MGTNTARAGLYKPDEVGESVDVARLNANMEIIDARLGYLICTSTTRPVSPYQGMQIYETDTKIKGFWDGTNWIMEETLWTNMILAASCTVADSYTPKYRMRLNRLEMQGRVTQGGSYIWAVPVGFRKKVTATPTGGFRYPAIAGNSGGAVAPIVYDNTHNLFTAASSTVNLDSISWPIEE